MFGSGFSEQFQDTFEFDEEEEQCSSHLFSTFLHYLSGCGKSCMKISENDIPALLKVIHDCIFPIFIVLFCFSFVQSWILSLAV